METETESTYAARIAAATTLDELAAIITEIAEARRDCADATERQEIGEDVDWPSLPAFGGEAPARTDLGGVGVWSWDATRWLVGTCPEDMRIEEREAGDGADEPEETFDRALKTTPLGSRDDRTLDAYAANRADSEETRRYYRQAVAAARRGDYDECREALVEAARSAGL